MSNKVYADLSALENWNTRLNKLNDETIAILDKIHIEVESFTEVWEGNISRGFIDATNKLIADNKARHGKMKNVDDMLTTISESLSDR